MPLVARAGWQVSSSEFPSGTYQSSAYVCNLPNSEIIRPSRVLGSTQEKRRKTELLGTPGLRFMDVTFTWVEGCVDVDSAQFWQIGGRTMFVHKHCLSLP